MTKFIDWFNQLSEEGKKYYLGCLPETLLDGKDYTKLYKLLSDYEFITTKINHPLFGIQALIEDYDLLDNSKVRYNSEYAETVKALKLIQGTLSRSAHIIFQDSKQLKGQLSARLTHFDLPEIKNLLAQIATDKNIGLYSLMGSLIPPGGGGLIRTLEGHSYSVEAIAVTPDGKTVISGSDDKTIKIWDLRTGTEKFTLTGHSDWVNAIAVTPDGKTVISGSVDKTIKIWDLVTGTEKFTVKGHSDFVNAIAVTPDGKTVISGSVDKTIKIWDLVTGTEKFTVKGHSYSVKVIVFTPDGKTVISASTDNTIKIWDVETGTEKFTLKGHSSWVSAIALAPDGKTLISASRDNTIEIWDLATRKEIATFTGESPINCCTVAPDGVTIVAGEESGRLNLLLENLSSTPPQPSPQLRWIYCGF
jgi:WD40 repeat protein